MGRSRLKIVIDEKTKAEIEERYLKATDPRDKERLLAIRLASKGTHNFEEIAEVVGRARSGIQIWFKAFIEGGIEGLLKRKKAPGKESPLQDETILAALREGLKAGRWRTVGQITQWLKNEYGIERKTPSVYYWVGKSKGVLKVPRPVHIKKDETAAQAFKEKLCERLKDQNLPKRGGNQGLGAR